MPGPTRGAALFLALMVAACATAKAPTPVPAPTPAPPPVATTPAVPTPPAPTFTNTAFADLPGWADEDHAAALTAFRAGCVASREARMQAVCREAQGLDGANSARARQFFEAHFRPEALSGDGLLTAYYSPEYEARAEKGGEFTAPVRPRPADLVGPHGGGNYPLRSAIEARSEADAIAWMRPEELFFLQIQGSGALSFPDGRRMRAVFEATNGAPFKGVATAMRDRGLLADNNTSGESIRAWLAAHRGPQAEAIMRLNPRYVFFRLEPDDGSQPIGAAGIALPAGRSIAVDLSRHAAGEVYWIDARAPALAGAFPAYRRLVVALDTGGAIKGDIRADLYLGRGQAAGVEAGRVRHTLRLYRLTPLP